MSTNIKYYECPLVLDNGSGVLKAGYSGEEYPRVIIPSVIGKPKQHSILSTVCLKPRYIGEEAQAKRGALTLTYPINHGVVTNWEDVSAIWEHVYYNELRIIPDKHPILMTEAVMNPRANRCKMAQILFEDFGVPALFVATQAVLALYSSGRTTGCVVDSGDGISHIVPIHDGYRCERGEKRLNLAGRDLTTYLARLLLERDYKLHTSAEMEIAREIKESLCYVALDFDGEMRRYLTRDGIDKPYELPDGNVIKIGSEMFRCPEALFRPSLIGREDEGLHEAIVNSISKCALDIRRDLYRNVLLCGGSTMLPHLVDRLIIEINKLTSPTMKTCILAPENRNLSVWLGGSIVSSLDSFDSMWIARKDFEEIGERVLFQNYL